MTNEALRSAASRRCPMVLIAALHLLFTLWGIGTIRAQFDPRVVIGPGRVPILLSGSSPLFRGGSARCGTWLVDDKEIAISIAGQGLFAISIDDGSSRKLASWKTCPAVKLARLDRTTVVAATRDGFLLTLDMKGGVRKRWRAHSGALTDMSPVGTSGKLATCSVSGTVKIWDPPSTTPVASFDAHRGPVWSLDGAANAERLVSGGADGKLFLWDTSNGRAISHVELPGNVGAVAIDDSGDVAVGATWNGEVRLWHAGKGTLRTVMADVPRSFAARAADMADDGKSFAVGGFNGGGIADASDGHLLHWFRRTTRRPTGTRELSIASIDYAPRHVLIVGRSTIMVVTRSPYRNWYEGNIGMSTPVPFIDRREVATIRPGFPPDQ